MAESTDLEVKASDALSDAQSYLVETNKDFVSLGEMLKDLKGLEHQVLDTFDPICSKAHAAWKESVAQREKHLKPIVGAMRILKEKGAAYQEAEQKRIEQELRIEQERAEAEARAKRDAEAKALREAGERKAAAAVKAAPLQVDTTHMEAIAAQSVAQVEGVSVRKTWSFTITDALAIPRHYLIPDEVKIRKVVLALGKEHGIPGVQAVEKSTMAVRR